MRFYKYFHSSAAYQNLKKSFLGDLRKKTGYSLSSCRRALELHDNDPVKAEKWLEEQAKTLGLNAAFKLQNRKSVQGLIGVAVSNKKLAMVEVNCETDFVAKNNKFRSLVELVANACFSFPVLSKGQSSNKIILTGSELGKLEYKGKILEDEIAVLVGLIGENIVLKRGYCFEATREDINIAATVHPPVEKAPILLGKYGAFVAFVRSFENPSEENFGYDLCRHIIGLNPKRIGEYAEGKLPNHETDLIHQEFLFDDSVTIGELLKQSGITVLEFNRFECGETDKEDKVSLSQESTA